MPKCTNTQLPLLHFYQPATHAYKRTLLSQSRTMSSPASRRSARNSATPRRNARTSLAPQSSPQGADAQLRSEASQVSQRGSANGTPRSAGDRQTRNFESMTPFFESSPAPNGSGEQQEAAMEDGDRTPRASGTARSTHPHPSGLRLLLTCHYRFLTYRLPVQLDSRHSRPESRGHSIVRSPERKQ